MFVCVKLAAIIFTQALSKMPKKCKKLLAVTKRGLKNSIFCTTVLFSIKLKFLESVNCNLIPTHISIE